MDRLVESSTSHGLQWWMCSSG